MPRPKTFTPELLDLFINKVIEPMGEDVSNHLQTDDRSYFPNRINDYMGSDRESFRELLNQFVDDYFTDISQKLSPYAMPPLMRKNYDSLDYDEKEDYVIVKGSIGGVNLYRKRRDSDGVMPDWISLRFIDRLVEMLNEPDNEALYIGDKAGILCAFMGYNGLRGLKTNQRIQFISHPIWDAARIEDWTGLEGIVNHKLFEDTDIYRELNARSNELFRYVADTPDFVEYLLGIKQVSNDPEEELTAEEFRLLFRFTEIAEFWEEAVVNQEYFKRKDYQRWREYRKFLFEKSSFVRRYFIESGWNHSPELLGDLGIVKAEWQRKYPRDTIG